MADKMFVVVAYGGSYDDAWEQNVVGSTSAQKAQDYIDARLLDAERFAEIDAQLSVAAKSIIKQLPAGKPLLPTKPWPAGLGEKDITPEMRAEREAIQQANAKINQENSDLYQKQYAEEQAELLKIARGLGLTEAIGDMGVLVFLKWQLSFNYRIDEIDCI